MVGFASRIGLTEVWVFKPAGWYIKFYLKTDAWFVSFHKEGMHT